MLENKVALITGGTRGIGFETVRLFLKNKAKVAFFGSRKESIDKATKKLLEEYQESDFLGLYPNLSNEQELKEAFKKVDEKFGHIDILINNAGISSSTPLINYT